MEENPVLINTIHIEQSRSFEEENLLPQTIITFEKGDKESANESEYDSAGSYSEEGDNKEKTDDSGAENESDAEGNIIRERQEGDGQESIPQKKVDDDEDKKNPQYIPKRGTFYEHDDRTAEDVETVDSEDKEKQEKEGKKKLWQEKKERWSHDRFNDQEQIPKSKAELIQIYGYDIRNEDGPPRARRRRRYGRGPNKYTRNWEDEDAYNKPVVPQRPSKKPQNPSTQSNEEFPPLDSHNRRSNKPVESPKNNRERDNTHRKNWQNNRRSEETEELPTVQLPQNTNSVSKNKQLSAVQASGSTSDNKYSKIRSGGATKSKGESAEPKNIRDSDYKGFTTKIRMGRNFKSQNSNNKNQKKDDFIQSQNFSSKRTTGNQEQQDHELENLMSNMNVQESRGQDRSQGKGQNNQRQGSVPPRLQGEQKGSKRYSSIRQRSLPESNNPPIMQHPSFYATDLNQPQQAQGAVIHQNPNLLQTPAGITQLAAPPAIPISQQVPVTATPILQAPPQFAPPFPQPPAFIQAAVPPPTYLPQQAPPIINYVQTPPQYSAGYQGYQAPFNPVTQPTELYQPQGGITYYSTDQQITQRIVPPKRPKAAIPIIAPPTFDPRKGEEDRQTDYISENNSVE